MGKKIDNFYLVNFGIFSEQLKKNNFLNLQYPRFTTVNTVPLYL